MVPVLLLCRYRVPADRTAGFTARARRAVELLAAQPTCRQASLARATEPASEPAGGEHWLLVAEFDSVSGYRRALSPFEVREHVVPLLAEAEVDGPATFEQLVVGAGGQLTERPSLIAADAGRIGVGEAAGPAEPR